MAGKPVRRAAARRMASLAIVPEGEETGRVAVPVRGSGVGGDAGGCGGGRARRGRSGCQGLLRGLQVVRLSDPVLAIDATDDRRPSDCRLRTREFPGHLHQVHAPRGQRGDRRSAQLPDGGLGHGRDPRHVGPAGRAGLLRLRAGASPPTAAPRRKDRG